MRWVLIFVLACGGWCVPAGAIDAERLEAGRELIRRAEAFLLSRQRDDGSWRLERGGPRLPAVTGLVVVGLSMGSEGVAPGFDADASPAARGALWLMGQQRNDGSIHDGLLPSYNTAIAASALSRVRLAGSDAAAARAVEFLRTLQYSEDPRETDVAERTSGQVDRAHPAYGGVGYGRHGRPDLSNVSHFLQAMHDAGVPSDDPAFQRALVFLKRVQMDGRINPMAYAEGDRQGGFIYSVGPNGDALGEGESKADPIVETRGDGTVVTRLRAYGSMTYAGFKSYAYAELAPDDPRVRAARGWIARHYTLDENPGLGTQGLYYYCMTFARALSAWGEPTLRVEPEPGVVLERDWANDLVDRLGELQEPNGSFRVEHERWMEGEPVLITAYALIALRHAVAQEER